MADEQIVRFRFTGDTSELDSAMVRTEAGLQKTSAAAGRASRAFQSVAIQIPDVASQMAAGTNATTVFIQQGLQVAQVNMDLVTAGLRTLAGTLTGPVGLALAGGVAAFSELESILYDSRQEAERFNAALTGQYQALSPDRTRAAAAAYGELNSAVEDARILLLQETGELTALEVQQAKAIQAAREFGDVKLLETAAREAALRVQQDELEAQIQSGRLNQEETLAALARVDQIRSEEIPAAEAATAAIREEVAAKIDSINSDYNRVASIRAVEAAAAEAEKAARERAAAERARAAEQARADREAAAAQREADRLAAEARRRQEAHDNEVKRKRQKQQAEIARTTAEYQRQLNEATAAAIEEENAIIEAGLARRTATYEAHFGRVVSLSQSFGTELVLQQGNIGAALVETGRQALATETANLAQEFARRATVYALIGNLPQAAAYAAGAAALGVSSGVLQAGGLRALNGSGTGRGLRSGRR